LVWADSNGIWHEASDIRGGTFGDDEVAVTDFRFINDVTFDEKIIVGDTIEDGDNSSYSMDLDSNTKMKDLDVNIIKSGTSGNVIIQLG